MKKFRTISLLLALALFCSMLLPGTMANAAEGDSGSGMVINKTATANSDGSYTIQLEAYATGSKVISEVKKDIPTDIVLVLDQSGSMVNDIGTVSFSAYSSTESTNSQHYDRRHNGGSANLYYPLENGAYASVSVTVQQNVTYKEITNGKNGSTSGNATSYWTIKDSLYAKVNGVYHKVTIERTGRYWNGNSYDRDYTYSLPDDTVICNKSRGDSTSPEFTGTDDGVLYQLVTDRSKNVYTYTYTDANGETQTIGTSTGANTTFDTTLYQRNVSTSGGGSRLNALKTAVTTFSNSVAKKAAGEDGVKGTDDDVNHRVAVVGFATGDYTSNSDYPTYENTELFIGAAQHKYNVDASNYYASAFQNMNTQAGYDNVIASKNALAARGATYTNYGLLMANGIFAANPLQEGEQRNRVVIVFTDGVPGYSSYDQDIADKAITQGNTAKNTYGATVYTVGIFSGADATSAGDSNGTSEEKANWFMQKLSSNNGKPQTPSYYLSAADSNTLNNIFQQISDQIESGGSSTTLSSETVIKDIISPAFALPVGATANDITLETYRCTGKTGDVYTWTKNENAMGATATVNGDQVSVSGFNFAENYVGTVTDNGNVTYRGHKLVIKFNVTPKAGFLGGNNIYTNTSAGVYENSSATTPVLTFNRPQVNVPIGAVSVTAQDKNVYLLSDLTAAQLKEGATVTVGDVSLDLSKANDTTTPYGLEPWQTEYVNISVQIKDAGGNDVTVLSNLKQDTTYTVSVTVSPKTNGTGASGTPATPKSGSAAANINVFKPVLTFQDSEVYYGDAAPTGFSNNLTTTLWKHGTTQSASVSMIGDVPTLALTYTPEAGKIVDGKINTKQDIPVDVTVKIGSTDVTDYTTFLHSSCTGKNCAVPTGKEFLLHVKTCQLTIEKTGGAAGEPYVFTVCKNGQKYTEVTIVGNASETIVELPVGTYTIQEDTGWSWRYTANYGNEVVLSAQNPTGSITCTNTLAKNSWLNGFSAIVKNIFGDSGSN